MPPTKHQRELSTTTEENVWAARQLQLAAARNRRSRQRRQQRVANDLESLHPYESVLQLGWQAPPQPTDPYVGLRVQGLEGIADLYNYIPQTQPLPSINEQDHLYPLQPPQIEPYNSSHLTRPQVPTESQTLSFLTQIGPSQPRCSQQPDPPETQRTRAPRGLIHQFFQPQGVPILSISRDYPPPQEEHLLDEEEGYNSDYNGGSESYDSDNNDDSQDNYNGHNNNSDNLKEEAITAPPSQSTHPSEPEPEPELELSSNYSTDFNPQSERESDEEDLNTVNGDPVLLVAERLVQLLLHGIKGCTAEEHINNHHKHIRELGNDHHSLDEIYPDEGFPSVLHSSDFLTPADLQEPQNYVAPVTWRAIFCGVSERSYRGRPLQVCLHREESQASEPEIAYDIDSFLGFANSLAFAKHGIMYQPAPQVRQNMTNNVHLQTDLFQLGTNDNSQPSLLGERAMLRDVPHFHLGRLEGITDVTIHVLFPHLPFRGRKFIALSRTHYEDWFSRIFHPAVYKHTQAHYSQHIPPSFRAAIANSRARQVEARLTETASYQAQQALGYYLQPAQLGLIWDEVLSTIGADPALAPYRDPQLFFSAKGTKLAFKSNPAQPSLVDTLDRFELRLADIIDMDLVDADRFFVDLGKETCPPTSVLTRHMSVGPTEEPQTYLWRRCCQERHAQLIYDGHPPAKGSAGQYYYPQNMLADSGSLTSEPTRKSLLYRGGVRYFQLYNSVKEVWDAAKTMPFNNDALEEMTLDPDIRQAARGVTRGHAREAHVVEASYRASKHRARIALKDSQRKSFGLREEYRVSWRLFCNIQAALRRSAADGHTMPAPLVDCPSYAWAVRTEVFLRFLHRSVNKFAAGFELIRARSGGRAITWEQTKMMAVFLRSLRYVLGGVGIQQESALWWSRREFPPADDRPHDGSRVFYGLGFQNTLGRYGYCWFEPRFDWAALQFHTDVTNRTLFGNSTLKRRYLRHGSQLRHFFTLTQQADRAVEWLQAHRRHERIRARLIAWLTHICLRQFRIDLLEKIKSEIKEDQRTDALQGLEPFSYETLSKILTDSVYLTKGHKTFDKNATNMFSHLFAYRGRGVNFNRQHWQDLPFRKLYARVDQMLVEPDDREEFRWCIERRLFQYYWIMPHIGGGHFTQKTKAHVGGERMWYSVIPNPNERASNKERFIWGQTTYVEGRPPSLPEYVSWEQEEWKIWLRTEIERGGAQDAPVHMTLAEWQQAVDEGSS